MNEAYVRDLIDAALAEDVGAGDWTTQWTVPEDERATARIVAKVAGILSGIEVAAAVFHRVDPELRVTVVLEAGAAVHTGDAVLRMHGAARSILTAERVSLNFLQHLCGVATATAAYVEAVRGTGARILDTRKTIPGLRALQKRAVRDGGGGNHRFGLHDMVLIKENHIAAAGGIGAAVDRVRRLNQAGLAVEVETTTLAEVREALTAGVDRILFDNMPLPMLREAAKTVRAWDHARPETEASGGVTLASVRSIAEAGVDFISIGALTHSAPALDLSLLVRAGDG